MVFENQIRVINLLPGSGLDDVQCEVLEVFLEDEERVRYEALSYVWGQSTQARTVTMGDERKQVTDNLYDALLRLRHSDSKRTLWTDQLCIDQWDPEEKSQQVALMGRIYKSCERCIIWLGELDSGDTTITHTDAEIALNLIRAWGQANARGNPARLAYLSRSPDAAVHVKHFIQTCERWWMRMWTLQEVVLAPVATMLWADLVLDWRAVADAVNGTTLPHFLMAQYYHVSNLVAVVRSIEWARSDKLEHPMRLLQRWRYRDATDPRDKIYSIMGLFECSPFPSVPVCDYTVDAALLFRRVTLDLIRQTGSLAPIIGQNGEPHVTPGLSSWCLDFVPHNDGYQRNVRFFATFNRMNWYSTNADRLLRWHSQWNERATSVLPLYALYVDRINAVGDVYRVYSDRRECILGESDDKIRKTIDKWENLVRENSTPWNTSYPLNENGEDPPEHCTEDWPTAFCKTIMGDVTFQEFPRRRFHSDDIQRIRTFRERGACDADVRGSIHNMVLQRGFFITANGFIGIGPPNLAQDDEVWIFAGCKVPLILRPKERLVDKKYYTFVGDAYVQGIMNGDFARDNNASWENIWLF